VNIIGPVRCPVAAVAHPDPMLRQRTSTPTGPSGRPFATTVIVVALLSGSACTAARTDVPVTAPPAISGTLADGVYKSANGALTVRVPPVFADWSEAEQRVDWQNLDVAMPIEHDMRIEDGYNEVDGTKITWVIFGPSSSHPDEIYHVVVAEPPPYHRYDDLTRYAREIVDGYLDQYDAQYAGRATEVASKYTTAAGNPAIYAVFRYDFAAGARRTSGQYSFHTAFCLFNTPGHRLVTVMIEHRPGAAGSGGRNYEQWREESLKTGGCWNEWIATLRVADAVRPPLTFQ